MFKDDNDFMEQAFQYKKKLHRIAEVKVGDIYESEDAVSEAILKACKKRNQLRDKSKLYHWLIRIVINHCNDILRSKYWNKESFDEIQDSQGSEHEKSDPHHRIAVTQEIERVLDIMLTLEPEEHSEVAILYFYRKFNYDEIADMLDIPVGTVKSRLSRARLTLLNAFKKANIKQEDLDFIKDISRWPEIKLQGI